VQFTSVYHNAFGSLIMTGKRGALAVDWELTVDDEEPIADHKRY
jgi:hypothetical protein